MSTGSFELRAVEWTPATAVLVTGSLLSAGIHLAIAATTGNNALAVMGLGILPGFVVFFTELWKPVLYLVGAIYMGVTSVIWLLAGRSEPLLGIADKLIQAVDIALFVYLLVVEMRVVDDAED